MTLACIAVFGEVLLDEFPDGAVIGGAPYNVARALACFGADPLMITRTGQDDFAALIRQDMRDADMRCQGVQSDKQWPTGRVLVGLDANDPLTHTFEIVRNQAYDQIDGDDARRQFESYLEQRGCRSQQAILYFGTLALRQLTSRSALRSLLSDNMALRYLDLNLRQQEVGEQVIREAIAAADILKINEDELQILLTMYPVSETIHSAKDSESSPSDHLLTAMLYRLELKALIVTLGAEGYAYADQQGNILRGKPAQAVDVADTVGAGDAFSAVFLLGLLKQWPTEITLRRAQDFAGAICQVRGAAGPRSLYKEWLQAWQ
ncbi:PfkB family carbohydrate kinase [Undibacterium luofuense]|uniref:PfkB family carbohydrate kinase n=1 Tax=Undibacterium luofuense TaxID=2828733 RepID=UPI0030EF7852